MPFDAKRSSLVLCAECRDFVARLTHREMTDDYVAVCHGKQRVYDFRPDVAFQEPTAKKEATS
jgi:hypothetical protein